MVFCHVKILNIYAYGIISPNGGGFFDDGCDFVKLKDFAMAISANADAEEIIVHINCPGGNVNEGFGIYDLLRSSGKKITTVIEGYCGSMATVLSLAGDDRKMFPNSEYFIHPPRQMMDGTAEEIQQYAQELLAAQDRILDVYVQRTGGDKDKILAMMKQETTIDSKTALEMKFITEIVSGAMAFHKSLVAFKKNPPTTIDTMKLELKNAFEKGINAVNDLAVKFGFKKVVIPATDNKKALDEKIVGGANDGKMLTIDTTGNTDEADPEVGNPVTMDGAPCADADYTLEDGTTITCVGGVITVIANDADAKKQVEALKKENVKLKAELLAEKTAKKQTEDAMTLTLGSLTTVTEKLKSVKSSYVPPIDGKEPNGDEKSKSRVALAREKEKAEEEAKKK